MGIEKRKYPSGRTSYMVRLRIDGRTHRSSVFPSRELADIELGKWRKAIQRGTFEQEYGLRAGDARRTFAEAAGAYSESREREVAAGERSATTQERERITVRCLKDRFGDARLREMTTGDVNGWIFERRKAGVKGKTINRELSSLRGIFKEAKQRGWVDTNPALEVERCKEGESPWRWLTPDEARRLLAACRDAPAQARHLYPLVVTALYTGMRRGELLGLLWHDVHLRRAELEVVASKSGHRRVVPLRPEVVTALRKHKRRAKGEYVFGRGGGEVPFAKVRRSFQSAVEAAKLGSVRFHDLRHTAASWMAQEGADLYAIARVLGHRDIGTTMRYSHLVPRTSRRAVERMPALPDEATLIEHPAQNRDEVATKSATFGRERKSGRVSRSRQSQ